LALSAELQRRGTKALVLDQQTAGANTSRAAVVVHARTLEVLEPLGVVPEFLRNGLVVPTFHLRDRGRILATISFKDLKTAYPFTLMCPQNQTEAILLERLEALGGSVQRPHKVVSIQPTQHGVEVQFTAGDELRTVSAKWVVGCDGAHSIVREQASIPFEGGAYEEDFILADVEMDWPLEREEADLFLSDKGLMVVVPLPKNILELSRPSTMLRRTRPRARSRKFCRNVDRRDRRSRYIHWRGQPAFTFNIASRRCSGRAGF
jgi:2-polyprenyl-6-methoxyphenol hydroxylase-like FAD-dependent oxidoreductase